MNEPTAGERGRVARAYGLGDSGARRLRARAAQQCVQRGVCDGVCCGERCDNGLIYKSIISLDDFSCATGVLCGLVRDVQHGECRRGVASRNSFMYSVQASY